MAEIVRRRDWAHRPTARPPHRITVRQNELWLHHGAAGRSDLASARAYLDFHIGTRKYRDVAYSWLIAGGRILEGRGPGVAGGHTRTRNTVSYGICMVGSYSVVPPSDRDIEALVALLRHGVAVGWWDAPTLTGGHRDAPGAATTCPGDALHQLIPDINRLAQEDDLTPEQDRMLRAVYRELCEGGDDSTPGIGSRTIRDRTWQSNAALGRMERQHGPGLDKLAT